MVIVTSGYQSVMAASGRSGAHALIVESASDDSNFNSRRKKRKRGSGKFIPDGWEPPGGRTGNGCEQQPPDRREGGLLLAPMGGAGRIFGSPRGGAREGVRTANPKARRA